MVQENKYSCHFPCHCSRRCSRCCPPPPRHPHPRLKIIFQPHLLLPRHSVNEELVVREGGEQMRKGKDKAKLVKGATSSWPAQAPESHLTGIVPI